MQDLCLKLCTEDAWLVWGERFQVSSDSEAV